MIMAIGAASLLAVRAAGSSSAQKLTVTDNLGRAVEVPSRAGRILSLQPEITRIIVALSPDVIFASPSEFLVPDSIQRALGLPVVALSSQGSFDRLLEEIELVGRVTGLEKRAKELVDYFRENMAAVACATSSVPSEKRPRVYLAFWTSLLRSPVSYEPVNAAGGENVAAGLLPSFTGSPGTVVTIEQIIKWDPDIILLHGNYPPQERQVTVDQVLTDKRLSSVKAVRNGQVFYTFGYWYWWDPAEVAPGHGRRICPFGCRSVAPGSLQEPAGQ